MSEYQAPLDDMRFALAQAGLECLLSLEAFCDFDRDTVEQVLDEAAKFAADVLAPLNVPGDQAGCHVADREVIVADGFADAYRQFVENGWQSLPVSADAGGMGLPEVVGTAALEMWNSANMSFALCPLLTAGAVVALETHGSDRLKSLYLPKLATGEWCGTMNLTEAQAGSDLAALTTRATPDGDHYRIKGTKIFITWGDHPMAANIIHLVLARLPDAPPGIRGISMFAVPKFLVDDDGSIGARNDVWAESVEHKMGIHASPTCVLNYGDSDGAIGYLVGEENQGLACMFTMMNHARLNVAVQGISLSECAYQLARSFAQERIQGKAPGHKDRVTIIHHADVRRMLLLMKSHTEAMRAAAYWTAALIDAEHHAGTVEERESASELVELLTPIVKGWLTEVAQEVTSLGVQVHGGMGFVEEAGAAQFMRDARILPIYEGTTGIQGNDLVGRKILGDDGRIARRLTSMMLETCAALDGTSAESLRLPLEKAVEHFEVATRWLVEHAADDPDLPGSAAVNLVMLAGTVLGGWQMAGSALAAESLADGRFAEAKLHTASFYCRHILPRAFAYAEAAMAGPEVVMSMPVESF